MYQSKPFESNWITPSVSSAAAAMPTPEMVRASMSAPMMDLPITPPKFQIDELQQGMQWSPLRHQMINTADVVRERVEWRKKFSDPRLKWHVRDAQTRQALAVNRMRLGPNTRVVPCDTSYPVTFQEQMNSFKNVDVNWS